MDLDPAKTRGDDLVQLLFVIVHAGEERAEAETLRMRERNGGKKVVDMRDLPGVCGGAAEQKGFRARFALQREEIVDRGVMSGRHIVKRADGGRCLVCQRLGEDMGVYVCNFHGIIFFPYAAIIGKTPRNCKLFLVLAELAKLC